MGDKYNPLSLIWHWRNLVAWQPTLDALWDPPGLDQPVDIFLRDSGALPVSAAGPSLGFMFSVRMLLFSLLWVVFVLYLTIVGWINAWGGIGARNIWSRRFRSRRGGAWPTGACCVGLRGVSAVGGAFCVSHGGARSAGWW